MTVFYFKDLNHTVSKIVLSFVDFVRVFTVRNENINVTLKSFNKLSIYLVYNSLASLENKYNNYSDLEKHNHEIVSSDKINTDLKKEIMTPLWFLPSTTTVCFLILTNVSKSLATWLVPGSLSNS